jgi:probable phosphoglycerate mutase
MRTKLWRTVQSRPSEVRFPDGESFSEVQVRMVSTARRIADAHPGATVVLCSHGDPIRLALSHFAGTHLDLFQRFIVSPASVSAVALGEGPPRLLAANATADLEHMFPREDGSMA